MADGPNADFFRPPIEDLPRLVVPTLSVYEVFRRAVHQRGPDEASRVVAVMLRGRVIDLDAALAVAATRLGLELGLPLADSVILATARAHGATLWTQDADFDGMPGVRYVRAPKRRSR